jgi:hypothetical protein
MPPARRPIEQLVALARGGDRAALDSLLDDGRRPVGVLRPIRVSWLAWVSRVEAYVGRTS